MRTTPPLSARGDGARFVVRFGDEEAEGEQKTVGVTKVPVRFCIDLSFCLYDNGAGLSRASASQLESVVMI